MSSEPVDILSSLPQEALAALFTLLPISEASNLCLVCKNLASVGTSDEVWRRRVVAIWPQHFSTRPQINQLIRDGKYSITIPTHRIKQDNPAAHDDSSTRLFWREIFFFTKRIEDANNVVKIANARISDASSRQPKLRRGKSQKKNLLTSLASHCSSMRPIEFSMSFTYLDGLLQWMEELLNTLDEIETNETDDEAALQAAARVFAPFKEDLLSSYIKLALEFAVQICRDADAHPEAFELINSFFVRSGPLLCSYMWMGPFPQITESVNLILMQISRIVSSLTPITPHIKASLGDEYPVGIYFASPFFDMLLEWSTNYGKKMAKNFIASQKAPVPPASHLMVSCMLAFAHQMDAQRWETKLVEIASGMDRHSEGAAAAQSSNQESKSSLQSHPVEKGLNELDPLLSQVFMEIPADAATWRMFKIAVLEFERRISNDPKFAKFNNPASADVWRLRVPQMRVLALVAESCRSTLVEEMDWIIEHLFRPTLNSTNAIWRKTMAMSLAQLVYDVGDELISPHLPKLLAFMMPLMLDPSVADYARNCSINLWSAIENADNSDREDPTLKHLSQIFVNDALSVVESRQGDWAASALALGCSAVAMGRSFEPFYDKCLSVLMGCLKNIEPSSMGKESICNLVEAVSYILKLPMSSSLAQRPELSELATIINHLIQSGTITFRDKATVHIAAACGCWMSGNTPLEAEFLDLVMPEILKILNTPPATLDPTDPDNMTQSFEHTFVGGNFVAVSRVDLDLRLTALDAVHLFIEGNWRGLWAKYWHQFIASVDNVIRNEFNADRISGAAILLRDLLLTTYREINAAKGDQAARDPFIAQLRAEVASGFTQTLQTMYHVSRGTISDTTVASTCAEMVCELCQEVPRDCINPIDIQEMFDWMTHTLTSTIDQTTLLRNEAAGIDPNDEDEDNEELDEEEDDEEEEGNAEEAGDEARNDGPEGAHPDYEGGEEDVEEEPEPGDEQEEPSAPQDDTDDVPQEGPGSAEFELQYEVDTDAHRNGLISICNTVQAICEFTPGILEKFIEADEWRSEDKISDPCGAQFALCIAAVLVEKGFKLPELSAIYDDLIHLMIDGCQSPAPYVAQAATCGLGIAATFTTSRFEKFVEPALENLKAVWDFEEAHNDPPRWGSVLDNVCSSFGKIVVAFKDSPLLNKKKHKECLAIFMARLPFPEDVDENDDAAKCITTMLQVQLPAFVELLKSSKEAKTYKEALRALLTNEAVTAEPEIQQQLSKELAKLYQ